MVKTWFDELGAYAKRPSGAGLSQLTHDPSGAAHPDWSPDGRLLAYDTAGTYLDVANADGSGNTPVEPGFLEGNACSGGGSDPSFAPNGKHLAFVSADGTTIYTVSLHGGTKHRVVHDALPKASPVYSPDGKKIAYSTGGPNPGIWVVRAKGHHRKPKRIASSTGYVTWQPLPR